jgi:octaprenyl-diphosphate synthase
VSYKELIRNISRELKEIDGVLRDGIRGVKTPLLESAARYILPGGKRIRAVITLLSARLCTPRWQGRKFMELAAAIELIHTASLLHDDVIDGASTRRGGASINRLYGDHASILTGDLLLTAAAKILSRMPEEVAYLISDGAMKVVEGEVMELIRRGDLGLGEEDYIEIITHKTAHLFKVACEGAALLAGKDEISEYLGDYGLNAGVAFQIIDDINDLLDPKRARAEDVEEGKITLPIIYLLRRCNSTEKRRIAHAISSPEKGKGVAFILGLIRKYEADRRSIETAMVFRQRAIEALSKIKKGVRKKEPLVNLVDSFFEEILLVKG